MILMNDDNDGCYGKGGPNITCGNLIILTMYTFFHITTSQSGPNVGGNFNMFTQVTQNVCALHHNGVHFFHITTSKSGPNLLCFDTFHFQMCFAPHQHALFPHLNFQKSYEWLCLWHSLWHMSYVICHMTYDIWHMMTLCHYVAYGHMTYGTYGIIIYLIIEIYIYIIIIIK